MLMKIQPGRLGLAQLRDIHCSQQPVAIDESALPGIRASAALVQKAAQGGDAVYGVNTGFGKLANQRIAQTDLETLQLNLLRSHAVGVGEPCPNGWCGWSCCSRRPAWRAGFQAFVRS